MKHLISAIFVLAFVANASAQLVVKSSGSVGVGTTNPSYKLHVVGSGYFTSLTTGTLSATNFTASNFSVSELTTGTVSHSGPFRILVNNTISGFTGSHNNANVSFGYEALVNSSSSYYSGNTAIGTRALCSNITGYNNVANGLEALYNNTTGRGNIAIGAEALFYNETGSYNTVIGDNALRYHGTGSYNTMIGNYANGGGNDPSNSTAIGNGAYTTGSNQVRLGNSSVTSIGGYAAWSNLSDGRAKKNIQADVPGLAFINALQPVTYNLNLDALDNLMKTDEMKKSELPQELLAVDKKAREVRQKQVQTGFVAQDVEKAAKEIGYNFSGVDVDEMGIYALRYSEFVVPLVKAVQELSKTVQEQQSIIDELAQKVEKLEGSTPAISIRSNVGNTILTTDLSATVIEQCKLYQNIPNPFNQDTQIGFYIPESVTVAQLCIYNMQGTQLKQIILTQRGEGSQGISGSELTAGMYLYALIVDGKEIDTKRMILTK